MTSSLPLSNRGNDDLEQPPRRIEAETQLARRFLLIDMTAERPVGRREDRVVRCDPVFERREPWTLKRRKRGSQPG